jgi:hypothetical protein
MIHTVEETELLLLLSNRLFMTSQIIIVGYAYPGKHICNNARYLVTKNVKWFSLGYFSKLGFSDYTANCRPVLSSERAPNRYKTENFRQQHSDRK